MEQTVIQMIRKSLEKRLEGWDSIDNILSNNDLISKWLTCIMALGYNNDDAEAASQDIFEFQSLLGISIEDIRARVSQVQNRFGDEIAAFLKYVELRNTRDIEAVVQAVSEELEFVEKGQFFL